MPLIGLMDLEGKVQSGDKTRYNVAKSFSTPDVTSIDVVRVRPGLDGPDISVFNADTSKRFLDWAFPSDLLDIDSYNNKLYFSVNGASYTATLNDGTYDLDGLTNELQTALPNACPGTYTATYDDDRRLTISISSGKIALFGTKGPNSILPHIGFTKDYDQSSSIIGYPVEYGIRVITLTLGNDDPDVEFKFYQKVYSKSGDRLFSSDQDLLANESDILKYVPAGRSSFINVHRKAQERIIEWLDQNGFTDINGYKLTKFSLYDISEVSAWSRYLALEMIFRDFGNAKDDVFKQKADYYEKLALSARQRAVIRIDANGDNKGDIQDSPDSWTGSMYRK